MRRPLSTSETSISTGSFHPSITSSMAVASRRSRVAMRRIFA